MSTFNEALKPTLQYSTSTIKLSEKEKENLQIQATDLVEKLKQSLSLNGETLEHGDYELLERSIASSLEAMTIKNKEKYTPKKYKDKHNT
jgi:hypothetical protein